MKKLTERKKKHQLRVAAKRLRRIHRQRNKRKNARPNIAIIGNTGFIVLKRPKKPEYPFGRRPDGGFVLPAPATFSLLENRDVTLAFFDAIRKHAEKKHRIYLDMSGVNRMSPDAILYVLSLLDILKYESGKSKISGNFPSDEGTRQLLIDSGFFKYVYAKGIQNASNADILTIESDTLVQPEIAKRVVDFAKEHLGGPGIASDRSAYVTLIECMGNTKHHAYKSKRRGFFHPKWHLIALFDKSTARVRFTFLDNGVGIEATIKKKISENVLTRIGVNLDASLIFSALKGEFRTSTGLLYRGKGLPKIYKFMQDGQIENLTIMSNRGFVDCKTGETTKLDYSFKGTLLSWDFILRTN